MRKVIQSSRRKERKDRKRVEETGESDNDGDKGEKTDTEGKERGEERKRTTEKRTAHVMWKNTLCVGHVSYNNKGKRKHMFQTTPGR